VREPEEGAAEIIHATILTDGPVHNGKSRRWRDVTLIRAISARDMHRKERTIYEQAR
jgi:hypothetical protein